MDNIFFKEEWRPVVGFEQYYEVSNLGRVRSKDRIVWNGHVFHKKRGRTIKLNTCSNDYIMAHLYVNSKRFPKLVHRIVAEAFIPNIENKPQIDHINCNKKDNCVANLRWCTCAENMQNPITVERNSISRRGRKQGSIQVSKKSKPIIQYNLQGEVIRVYPSLHEANRENGYDVGKMSQCCRGLIDKVYGYRFEYA